MHQRMKVVVVVVVVLEGAMSVHLLKFCKHSHYHHHPPLIPIPIPAWKLRA